MPCPQDHRGWLLSSPSLRLSPKGRDVKAIRWRSSNKLFHLLISDVFLFLIRQPFLVEMVNPPVQLVWSLASMKWCRLPVVSMAISGPIDVYLASQCRYEVAHSNAAFGRNIHIQPKQPSFFNCCLDNLATWFPPCFLSNHQLQLLQVPGTGCCCRRWLGRGDSSPSRSFHDEGRPELAAGRGHRCYVLSWGSWNENLTNGLMVQKVENMEPW